MTCYTLYNPIVQRDFKYHMEVVGVPFTCLLLCIFFPQAEEQLREKVQEFIELQNKYDSERTDLMVK